MRSGRRSVFAAGFATTPYVRRRVLPDTPRGLPRGCRPRRGDAVEERAIAASEPEIIRGDSVDIGADRLALADLGRDDSGFPVQQASRGRVITVARREPDAIGTVGPDRVVAREG